MVRLLTPVRIQGTFGKALSFDGVDDYVKVPDSESLDLTVLTITAWLKTTQTGVPYFRVFSRRDTATWEINPYQLGFRSNVGTVQLVIGDGSNWNRVEGTTDIRDGKWHFIVGVVTGSELKVYVDGNLEATNTQTITPFDYDGSAMVGKAGSRFTEGVIDEVRIYNRALTQEEIIQLYKGGHIWKGLVLWLKFDEGTGTTAYDSSGYGNHGTIYGATWTDQSAMILRSPVR